MAVARFDETWAKHSYKGYSGYDWYRFTVQFPAGLDHLDAAIPVLAQRGRRRSGARNLYAGCSGLGGRHVVDVSGKGISAAILAATLQGMLYVQLQAGQPLEAIAPAMNKYLCNKNWQ